MMTCSIDGCERAVIARGWCGAHYRLWQTHGDPNIKKSRWDGHVKTPHPCAVAGCERTALKRRMCTLHDRRKRKSGDPNVYTPRGKRPRPPLAERFFAKTRREGDCLIWTGATDSWGYGNFRGPNGETRAHRVAWVLVHGPVPPGTKILHHCDRPPCVEEAHLFTGSHQDNMDDMNRKGRGRHPAGEEHGLHRHPEAVLRGVANWNSRLTDDVVMALRARFTGGETQTALAVEYGVSQGTVSRVVLRKAWGHVPWDITVSPFLDSQALPLLSDLSQGVDLQKPNKNAVVVTTDNGQGAPNLKVVRNGSARQSERG